MINNLMKTNKLTIILILLFFGCQEKEINIPSKYEMVKIAQSNQLWTGVAASKNNRIFVNFPRWSPNIANSVSEIKNNGELIPFPNEHLNNWDLEKPAKEYFICVQSVFVDKNNNLWILDTGLDVRKGIIENGPKLLKVDLPTNKVIQRIHFDEFSAPSTSYLNDIR